MSAIHLTETDTELLCRMLDYVATVYDARASFGDATEKMAAVWMRDQARLLMDKVVGADDREGGYGLTRAEAAAVKASLHQVDPEEERVILGDLAELDAEEEVAHE